MGFYRKIPSFDIGELNIENMFITDFLPIASGTYVKVYLMGLLFSKEENKNYRFDNAVLANMLKIPIEDIHEAWIYWEGKKLIVRHFHEDQVAYDVEFLSLRELYILDNFVSKSTAPSKTASAKNAVFVKENEKFKALCARIEKIIATPLKHADYRKINDFYTHYYKNADIIVRAFEYNYIERNIRNIKAIDSLLNSWIDQGFSTIEAIDQSIEMSTRRFKVYKEVLRILGMSFRMANQAEKEAIDRWIDEYHFEPNDLYDLLKSFSKSTMNMNFNYIETRLKDLHARNILTFEAYSRTEKPENTASQKSIPAKSRKKQYTIEKERTYSEDELEALLLKKGKNLK
ncbi:DnaD domain-containing protein [Fusibacter ferrireducens]|uniref:DnaD domain protein n=1 Tax=Fusibacter ferrireducens TaxID=2785058 RepID=A0ABR9ZS52_9FIRM|nr:DnaD domain protein [Fusibacter ferrireducens]MBF4693294.1 DnaD domain protein [Fusibacter ferrireducens]